MIPCQLNIFNLKKKIKANWFETVLIKKNTFFWNNIYCKIRNFEEIPFWGKSSGIRERRGTAGQEQEKLRGKSEPELTAVDGWSGPTGQITQIGDKNSQSRTKEVLLFAGIQFLKIWDKYQNPCFRLVFVKFPLLITVLPCVLVRK